MSVIASVVQAWADKLQSTIPDLEDAKLHLFAPWSLEALGATTNERHLALWPAAEPEVVSGFVAASPPGDLATQSFVILIWEDASEESVRRMDNEQANLDWLDLHEAIRAQLYDLNNQGLGDSNASNVRYQGAAFDVAGAMRVMQINFTTQAVYEYTS